MLRLTGSKAAIRKEALPKDDPKQRQPDISLAQSKLDWQPTVNLEAGLRRTIAYFEQLLSGE